MTPNGTPQRERGVERAEEPEASPSPGFRKRAVDDRVEPESAERAPQGLRVPCSLLGVPARERDDARSLRPWQGQQPTTSASLTVGVNRAQAVQGSFCSPELGPAPRLRPCPRIARQGAFDAAAMLRQDARLAGQLPRQDEQGMMRRRFDDLLQTAQRRRLGEERLQLDFGKPEGRGRDQLDEVRRAGRERDPGASPRTKPESAEPFGDRLAIVGAHDQIEVTSLRRRRPVDENATARGAIDGAQQAFLILDESD